MHEPMYIKFKVYELFHGKSGSEEKKLHILHTFLVWVKGKSVPAQGI